MKTVLPLLLFLIAFALAGSDARADELRIAGTTSTTIYSGHVIAMQPAFGALPNLLTFTAGGAGKNPRTMPGAMDVPDFVMAWEIAINTDAGPIVLECWAAVPAFVGETWAVDVFACSPP